MLLFFFTEVRGVVGSAVSRSRRQRRMFKVRCNIVIKVTQFHADEAVKPSKCIRKLLMGLEKLKFDNNVNVTKQ